MPHSPIALIDGHEIADAAKDRVSLLALCHAHHHRDVLLEVRSLVPPFRFLEVFAAGYLFPPPWPRSVIDNGVVHSDYALSGLDEPPKALLRGLVDLVVHIVEH